MVSVIFVYVHQLTKAGFQALFLLLLYFISYLSSVVTVSGRLMLLLPFDERKNSIEYIRKGEQAKILSYHVILKHCSRILNFCQTRRWSSQSSWPWSQTTSFCFVHFCIEHQNIWLLQPELPPNTNNCWCNNKALFY